MNNVYDRHSNISFCHFLTLGSVLTSDYKLTSYYAPSPNLMKKNILEEDVKIITVLKYKIGFLRYPLLILTCIQFCPLPAESRSLAVWNTVLQVPVMLSKAIIWVESEAQSVPVSLLADLFLFWLYIFGRERILMRN